MDNGYVVKRPSNRMPSLADEVANRLVEMIRQGEWEAGSRLPNEFELAEQFGVGRGSVREAVKTLVSRNVLEIRTAKGTFVCKKPGVSNDPFGLEFLPNKENILRDLWEVRLMLEMFCVHTAAGHATQNQISRMKELADQIDQPGGTDEQRIAYDIELHQCIAESSGNAAISVILPIIQAYIEKQCLDRKWDTVNAGHRAIISAIEYRSPVLAEAEIINHLSYFPKELRDNVLQRP